MPIDFMLMNEKNVVFHGIVNLPHIFSDLLLIKSAILHKKEVRFIIDLL